MDFREKGKKRNAQKMCDMALLKHVLVTFSVSATVGKAKGQEFWECRVYNFCALSPVEFSGCGF